MIVPIFKPKGPTSHDIIDKIRRITGVRKVGHAGTLDPLAEGVLVVGIGRQATKQLATITLKKKEYRATITLSATSTTDDAQGTKHQVAVKHPPTKNQVKQVLQSFTGTTYQTPPRYSAIKIKGRPAHRLARQGKTVILKPRPVTIQKITLLEYKWLTLKLRLVTGPGAYIRALARDLGKQLKTGGYLTSLTRTRVGQYTQKQALSLAQCKKQYQQQISKNKL